MLKNLYTKVAVRGVSNTSSITSKILSQHISFLKYSTIGNGNNPDDKPNNDLMDNAKGWDKDDATESEETIKSLQENKSIDEMKKDTVNYLKKKQLKEDTKKQ